MKKKSKKQVKKTPSVKTKLRRADAQKQKVVILEYALEKIKPYWRNPRINKDSIDPLIESIKKFGFSQPIIVDKELTIIAGHTRLEAAKKMGLKTVPVIVSDMDPKKAKEYRIIDNKTAEFSFWMDKPLIEELREFENLKEFEIFFKDQSLENFISQSIGNQMSSVSDEDITSAEAKQKDKYTEMGQKDLLEVTCRHCDCEFLVDRRDVETREK